MMLKAVLILLVHTVVTECGGVIYFCVENGTNYTLGSCVPRGPLDNCICQLSLTDPSAEVFCTDSKCDPVSCPNAIRPAGQCCEKCPAVECGPPTVIDSSSVYLSSLKPGSVATYKCYPGFKLVGENKRICQPNGTWSLEVGYCKAVCVENGTDYSIGVCVPRGPLDNCTCQQSSTHWGRGEVVCTDTKCDPVSCPTAIRPAGQCCEICPAVCTGNGITYKQGQIVPRGPCDICTCEPSLGGTQASVVCAVIDCVPVTCNNAFVPPGQCCATCPAVCTENGITYQSGEKMPNPDPCLDCVCDNGQVTCSKQTCPDLQCAEGAQPETMEGNCCPTCPSGCLWNGKIYPEGSDMPDPDPCNECNCYQGRRNCFDNKEWCSTPICAPFVQPVSIPGQCCLSCPLSTPVCNENGKTYKLGETVPRGPCDTCTCQSNLEGTIASVVCGVIDCVPVTCSDATIVPGQCCAICPADKAGECTTTDTVSGCANVEQCTGDQGCPGIQKCCSTWCGKECVNPLTKRCTYKGKRYYNRQRFRDECNDCWCTDGLVTCTQRDCLSVCLYNSVIYREGERIPDRNPCNMCLCERGEVSCRPVICHPRPDCDGRYLPLGQCCLVCPRDSNGKDDPNENDDFNRNNGANGNNDRNRDNGAKSNNDRNRNNGANSNNDRNRDNGAKSNDHLNRNYIANRHYDAHNNMYSNRRQGRH